MSDRQRIAHGEREQWVDGAAVVDELPVIGVEGAGPPAARGALVGGEPGDAALDVRVGGGDAGLAQGDDGQAGHVAVAGRVGEIGLGAQAGGAVALAPLLGLGKAAHGPAAVGALMLEDHCYELLLARGVDESGQLGGGPEQIGAVVIGLHLVAVAQEVFKQFYLCGNWRVLLRGEPAGRVAHGAGGYGG